MESGTLKYLLILFVIALALAPLGHFLPSKRQRKVARLREYAAVHGLFVEFRSTPSAPGAPVPSGEVIYYGKRLAFRRGKPIETASWVVDQKGWRGVGRYLPVPHQLEELSVNILAASVDPSSCGVYWTESADEDAVEQIRVSLEAWSEALMG